jgi:micrococcal nuclease
MRSRRIALVAAWCLAVVPAACGGSVASVRPSVAPETTSRAPVTTAVPAATPVDALGPTGPTVEVKLISVTDGDTIRVRLDGRSVPVRYIGMDSPELTDARAAVLAVAKAAAKQNAALLKGRRIRLETDVSETDRFKRLLRDVWVADDRSPSGWTLVNLELVRRGFAQVSTFPPDVKYVALLENAEAQARADQVGLWSSKLTVPGVVPLASVPAPTPRATPKATKVAARADCDPSYPTVCIPPPPPDLDCGDITFRRFEVLAPDPHHFDSDRDGIGCEG